MSRSPRTNVRRLAAGRLISVTGGAAAYTALMFTIWHRTHSASLQSLTLLLTFGVTGLLGPVAGALGDRFDRRRVMVIAELVAAGFFVVMAFSRAPGWLIALAFGSAVAESPFFSASRAAIPSLVERDEDIAWANGLVTIGVHSGITLGPVIGGVLLGLFGAPWVFGLNAGSFLVSVALTLTVHGRFAQERSAADREEHRGIAAGLRFLLREPVLLRMTAAWLVFLLGMGMGMVADAPLAESFRSGSLGFGLIIAFWGFGSVLGSVAGRRLTERTEPTFLVAGAAGIAAAGLSIGVAPALGVALASFLVMGASDGLTIVAEQGMLQRRTPDAVRSRVMAAFDAVLSLGLAVAYLLAGPVLHLVGPKGVYALGGVAAAVAAVVLVPLLRFGRAASTQELTADEVGRSGVG